LYVIPELSNPVVLLETLVDKWMEFRQRAKDASRRTFVSGAPCYPKIGSPPRADSFPAENKPSQARRTWSKQESGYWGRPEVSTLTKYLKPVG
jgi:hypothetical protein